MKCAIINASRSYSDAYGFLLLKIPLDMQNHHEPAGQKF